MITNITTKEQFRKINTNTIYATVLFQYFFVRFVTQSANLL